MRLTALNAKWMMPLNWSEHSPDFYIGVSFDCPHCDPRAPEHGPQRKRRLVVTFHPPVDPGGLQEKYGDGWWKRQANTADRVHGDTLDTLTLSPSINFDGHWGGFIQDGALSDFPRTPHEEDTFHG